jgi:hypothetical protein
LSRERKKAFWVERSLKPFLMLNPLKIRCFDEKSLTILLRAEKMFPKHTQKGYSEN